MASVVTHLWLTAERRCLCGARDGATSIDPARTTCPECLALPKGGPSQQPTKRRRSPLAG